MDEATFLRQRENEQIKKISNYLQAMKRVVLLTGAPILKSPIELHSFMQVVRPDLMPEFLKFANRYCEPTKKADGIHYNGASFTDELQFLF